MAGKAGFQKEGKAISLLLKHILIATSKQRGLRRANKNVYTYVDPVMYLYEEVENRVKHRDSFLTNQDSFVSITTHKQLVADKRRAKWLTSK